ncbi:hypothetical protein SBRY_70384 [Actinacidiphila bryophytorum]|uniref:Uncharacterized protein n=1 Tax=Actinacidiphila bryophytorum TaxID=1436133 RepID=A0A9W4H6R1_9ACTN|nr:hypothetical protein SBRY_70384 [Actinacidiphila bryophytorum]
MPLAVASLAFRPFGRGAQFPAPLKTLPLAGRGTPTLREGGNHHGRGARRAQPIAGGDPGAAGAWQGEGSPGGKPRWG